MSSVQSGYAQIPSRSKYLYAVAPSSEFTQLKLNNTIAAYPNSVLMYDGTILNTTDAKAFLTSALSGNTQTTAGDRFRDLGKNLYLQTRGRNDYIFTYVQEIKGHVTEGVPSNYNINSTTAGNFWLCTWAANDNANAGIGVFVVRTG